MRRHGRAAKRPPRAAELQHSARARLRQFRRASLVAVAAAGLLLMLVSAESPVGAAETDAAGVAEPGPPATMPATTRPSGDPVAAVQEATTTIRDMVLEAWGFLPKLFIAAMILLLAAVLSRFVRTFLRWVLRSWDRADAFSALTGVIIFLLALGAALSVLAGDARALVGSVGLAGLALSWALQAPIESFTGWLLNSFKGYYRVGDRVEVGEVFGDVYKIDILTTTVWEAGGPGKPVKGAQPTGALITFPNSEVLRNNIVNYTRDFPYVWDEVTFGVANESDLVYAARVIAQVAREVVGPAMSQPAGEYRDMLHRKGLAFDVAVEPEAFVSPRDAWTDIAVRYLVPARQRRRWASRLVLAVAEELARQEHTGRIMNGYPRTQVELLRSGTPPDPATPA